MARPRRQETLPAEGMSRVERPDIEEPAEDLRAITGELATLNERKRNAKRAAAAAMTAAGIAEHRYLDPDGVERRIRLNSKTSVTIERVRTPKDKSSASDEAGEQAA